MSENRFETKYCLNRSYVVTSKDFFVEIEYSITTNHDAKVGCLLTNEIWMGKLGRSENVLQFFLKPLINDFGHELVYSNWLV